MARIESKLLGKTICETADVVDEYNARKRLHDIYFKVDSVQHYEDDELMAEMYELIDQSKGYYVFLQPVDYYHLESYGKTERLDHAGTVTKYVVILLEEEP